MSYSSGGVCELLGSTFTTTSSSGACTVRYDQSEEDARLRRCPQVTESVTVTAPAQKANQTIAFGTLASKTFRRSKVRAQRECVVGTDSSSQRTAAAPSVVRRCTSRPAVPARWSASQPGNASYDAGARCLQTFSIAKVSQTIAFGPLAAKTYGAADFAVAASASSGLTVAFAGERRFARQWLHGPPHGRRFLPVTASPAGDANYNAAAAVSRILQSRRTHGWKPPASCTVPKVVGERLGAAKLAIEQRRLPHREEVAFASRADLKKGIVISQSRRPGLVLPVTRRSTSSSVRDANGRLLCSSPSTRARSLPGRSCFSPRPPSRSGRRAPARAFASRSTIGSAVSGAWSLDAP